VWRTEGSKFAIFLYTAATSQPVITFANFTDDSHHDTKGFLPEAAEFYASENANLNARKT